MLTLPNLLTLSRIFAVPLLVFLLWQPRRTGFRYEPTHFCMLTNASSSWPSWEPGGKEPP